MYSGIVEIIGIRELADISPDRYAEKLNQFYQVLENVFQSYDGLKVYGHRDYFFCSHDNVLDLLNFIQDFRASLMTTQDIMCRGVVMKGEYSLMRPESQNIKDIEFKVFDDFTAQLYGELYSLKGVAIKIAEKVVVDIDTKRLEDYVLLNYYLEDFDNRVFDEFHDLKMKNDLEYSEVKKICLAFEYSNNISPKLARYYIPLFNNLIFSWFYKTDRQLEELIKQESSKDIVRFKDINNHFKNEEYAYELENLLYNGYFNRFKKVKGIKIIYLFFFKNLMDSKLLSIDGDVLTHLEFENLSYIVRKMRTNTWLINYLKEDALWEAPRSLFNKLSKRKLFGLLQ
jgi:hypothetical protein